MDLKYFYVLARMFPLDAYVVFGTSVNIEILYESDSPMPLPILVVVVGRQIPQHLKTKLLHQSSGLYKLGLWYLLEEPLESAIGGRSSSCSNVTIGLIGIWLEQCFDKCRELPLLSAHPSNH